MATHLPGVCSPREGNVASRPASPLLEAKAAARSLKLHGARTPRCTAAPSAARTRARGLLAIGLPRMLCACRGAVLPLGHWLAVLLQLLVPNPRTTTFCLVARELRLEILSSSHSKMPKRHTPAASRREQVSPAHPIRRSRLVHKLRALCLHMDQAYSNPNVYSQADHRFHILLPAVSSGTNSRAPRDPLQSDGKLTEHQSDLIGQLHTHRLTLHACPVFPRVVK